MHPRAGRLRHRRQRGEFVAGAQVQVPGVQNDDRRRALRGRQRCLQFGRAHLARPAAAQRYKCRRADAEQPQCAVDAGMAVGVGQHADRRRTEQAIHLHIPAGAGQYMVAGGGKRGGVAHLAAGCEAVGACLRQVQCIEQQPPRNFLQHGAGRAGGGEHGILIPQRCQHISGMRGRQGAALHPGKKAPTQIAHQAGFGSACDEAHHVRRVHAGGGQGRGHGGQDVGAAAGRGNAAAGLAVDEATAFGDGNIKRAHSRLIAERCCRVPRKSDSAIPETGWRGGCNPFISQMQHEREAAHGQQALSRCEGRA